MNYRHAFHAGNFADLVKHAALTCLLARLTADPTPLTVVDTHAGAGLYDLGDARQARSGEAEAGVARLQGAALPPEFAGLSRAIERRNPAGPLRLYPGSPALVLDALRPKDRYVACELRDDDHAQLAALFRASGKEATAVRADGYATAEREAGGARGRLMMLIDPPFERADDYVRIVETLRVVFDRKPDAVALVWLPLKDLETLDGFIRRLEATDIPAATIAEARVRPLERPMRMNGCALVAINGPAGFTRQLETICGFVVAELGVGGLAKVWNTAAA